MIVLSVTSEVFPLVKTGGLADVAGALPGALQTQGISVVTLVPGYPAVMAALGGASPEPATMGIVGFLALVTNAGVALMLYRFRTGDANMRSVWICSRNDAIGNLAVMAAALGVFGTGSAWPDLIVAAILASLGISGGLQIMRHAVREMQEATA